MSALLARMRKIMMTGVLTLSPVAVALFVLYRLFVLLDQMLGRFLVPVIEARFGTYIPGLGFLLLLLLIFFTGLLARMYLGRKVISMGQWFLDRIPLLSKLAKAIRQILESFLTDNNELFRRAILLEYPRRGAWAVGFMTRRTEGEVLDKLETVPDFIKISPTETKPLLSVFVPTTPNPTSGVLVFVPEDEIVYLDMNVEDALKLVISGGALSRPNASDKGTLSKPDSDGA
jgi:uncharacterized membrane protein